MLEKELAQAVKLAQQANKEVEKLRTRLLKDAQTAVARGKRELAAARKKQKAANARLKKARGSLKSKTHQRKPEKG